jgi:hypothetical protein
LLVINASGKATDTFGRRYALSPKTVELHRALGNDLDVINGEINWSR